MVLRHNSQTAALQGMVLRTTVHKDCLHVAEVLVRVLGDLAVGWLVAALRLYLPAGLVLLPVVPLDRPHSPYIRT